MPSAVSNASPLVHLAKIGRLHLLQEFHQQVLVPQAVWREVIEQGQDYPETPLIERAFQEGWLQVRVAFVERLVSLLKLQLDEGESGAIALALQEQIPQRVPCAKHREPLAQNVV
jgi:predicted nucleic acid-binding protein